MKTKVKMSEFFLELFSEEVPAKLQINARKNLFDNFKNFFEKNNVIIQKIMGTLLIIISLVLLYKLIIF